MIESILKKYGVPSDFKYMAVAESGLTNAVSPADAVGFWQLLEGTAKDYGLEVNNEIDERYHLEKSTQVACRFILDSYKKYGSWTMAAASYNAGRNGIDTQIERQKETGYYKLLLGRKLPGTSTGYYHTNFLFQILQSSVSILEPMISILRSRVMK